jgi:hypothetical protein
MSKKLMDTQNIFEPKDRPGPKEKKKVHARSLLMKKQNDKNYHIISQEREKRRVPVTKQGLGLISVEEYNKSLLKSEIDTVFGDPPQKSQMKSNPNKKVRGNKRTSNSISGNNISMLSRHNILNDVILEEDTGYNTHETDGDGST